MKAGRFALAQVLDLLHWQTLARLADRPEAGARQIGLATFPGLLAVREPPRVGCSRFMANEILNTGGTPCFHGFGRFYSATVGRSRISGQKSRVFLCRWGCSSRVRAGDS